MSTLETYEKAKEQLAMEYLTEGRSAFFDNRLNEAALLVQNAINLFRETQNFEQLTLALNLMGVIYGAIGNEAAAINYFLDGLSLAIEYRYYNLTCLFYNNIGSRYQQLHKHEQAIDYFLKAEAALEMEESKKEERYPIWCMVTFLNLSTSYGELNVFELSEKYLNKSAEFMTGELADSHEYTFLITKCRLYWCIDKKDFVYEHLDKLMEAGKKNKNTSDYLQDVINLCDLLKKMNEYTRWKQLILDVLEYAHQQNTVFYYMAVTELWLDYCKATNDLEEFQKACAEFTELYLLQKEIDNQEKAAAIDIKIQLHEKENERKAAEEKATIDSLTGLGNRRLLEKDMASAINMAYNHKCHFTVGILDIDCFKELNDTYGHIQGDKCLKAVANVLLTATRGIGRVYRFGGDEFILIIDTGRKEIIETVASDIRKLLRKTGIENKNSKVIPELTMSQGYACFIPSADETTKMAIAHADKALYYVKEHGKNSYEIIMENQ